MGNLMVQQLLTFIPAPHAPPPTHTRVRVLCFPLNISKYTRIQKYTHMLSQAHNKLTEYNTLSRADGHYSVNHQSKHRYHSGLSLSSNIISFMSTSGRRSRVHSWCCLNDGRCWFDGRQGSLSCGWV